MKQRPAKERAMQERPTKERAIAVHAAPPERPPTELTSLTHEWWSSWRRANELGWEYLNAMSGLMRLNMDAFSHTTRRR